ncbi:MAG: acetylornithine deacetylase [Methylobacteriaceae bacterium]|jgi:acetylornithine deacetylase|nr:acetylornithine deacetylase [Methylobacteriaceae bacterium]
MPTPAPVTTLEMLEKLVAFDTTSEKSNLPIISFIQDYLASHGVDSRLFPNAAGDKATLLAEIGPADRPGIVLSGHTDAVPVTGQVWRTDPFRLTVERGKAYGRGAADMKGFVAAALAAVPVFVAARPACPIYLVFSHDEEISCLGSVDAIRWLVANRPLPAAAVVGEPTRMQMVDAHKNIILYHTTVTGREAHSAMPEQGASAVLAAGEFIAEVAKLADDFMLQGDASDRFDPPYSTAHVARVEGGTVINVLAAKCFMEWEVRGLPDIDIPALEARIAAFSAAITARRLTRFGPFGSITTENMLIVPGLKPEPSPKACRLIAPLLVDRETTTVSYGTEGGHFQAAGISTVVCGPGSIDQAHQPDEFITLAQLNEADTFLRGLSELIGTA